VEPVRLGGELCDLYTITYEEVSLLVCRATNPILPQRENLLSHQKVISQVMSKGSVIPFSFGTMLASEEDARVLMKHLYPQFQELFPQLHNKIELGLKVVAKTEWLERELQAHPHLQHLSDRVNTQSEAAAFYDQIQLGEAAQNFFLNLESQIQEQIYRPLADASVSAKLLESKSERVLFNAAFLIDKDKEAEFDQLVNDLYETCADKVDFEYSGPWPAYNFINIRLKIEGER
jgi:hypothetical protein